MVSNWRTPLGLVSSTSEGEALAPNPSNARASRSSASPCALVTRASTPAGGSARNRLGSPSSIRAAPLATSPSSALYVLARASPAFRAMAYPVPGPPDRRTPYTLLSVGVKPNGVRSTSAIWGVA